MTIPSKLANSMSGLMNIKKGEFENETVFRCRLVYSALSRLAYASLWDEEEMQDSPSITYFKHQISKSFEYFTKIFSEIIPYFDEIELINEIYNQFESTGQFYHTSFHIAPPVLSVATTNDLEFVRGEPLAENVAVSGLGAFRYDKNPTDLTVNKMFHLEENSVLSYWKQAVSSAHWQEFKTDYIGDFEFLNHNLSNGNPYWCNNPNESGICSIVRTKGTESRLYYLYKIETDKIYLSALPSFMTENGEYRRLSNGLFAVIGCLPDSTFHIEGEIVKLKIGYMYPPAEMNFIKLYSWPSDFRNLGGVFTRILNKDVFFSIKETLESIGYGFTEVEHNG